MHEDMPRECIYCSRHGQEMDYKNCMYEERKKDPLLCFLYRFSEEGKEEVHRLMNSRRFHEQ